MWSSEGDVVVSVGFGVIIIVGKLLDEAFHSVHFYDVISIKDPDRFFEVIELTRVLHRLDGIERGKGVPGEAVAEIRSAARAQQA